MTFGETSGDGWDALEERLAGLIEAYDRQGNHRSGTDADHVSKPGQACRHAGSSGLTD